MRPDRCPEHDWQPAHNCGACRSEALEAAPTQAPSVLTLTPEQIDVNRRGARIVRAAMAANREEQP